MKQSCSVTGMTCSACSAHVEKAVRGVSGVREVNVSLLTNSMVVDYDENATDVNAILHAVEEAGYGASLPQTGKQSAASSGRKGKTPWPGNGST